MRNAGPAAQAMSLTPDGEGQEGNTHSHAFPPPSPSPTIPQRIAHRSPRPGNPAGKGVPHPNPSHILQCITKLCCSLPIARARKGIHSHASPLLHPPPHNTAQRIAHRSPRPGGRAGKGVHSHPHPNPSRATQRSRASFSAATICRELRHVKPSMGRVAPCVWKYSSTFLRHAWTPFAS